MYCLLYYVLIIGVFVSSRLTEARPHAKLRGSGSGVSSQYPIDVISFPENIIDALSRPQFNSGAQRNPLITSYIANNFNRYLNGGPIIFDEDYDEPLRPQPIFLERSSLPVGKKANKIISSPQTIRKITPSNDESFEMEATTRRPNKVTTEFQPIIFVSSSTTTTESPSSTKQSKITIVSSSSECVQSEDNDCDEIIIEGSVYAPLVYRTPAAESRKLRNRKKHTNDGFFLA